MVLHRSVHRIYAVWECLYRSNDPTVYSAFSPSNINISLGMDYSADWLGHRLKGTFHIAPLAYNLKYTRMLELSDRLGIGTGHHSYMTSVRSAQLIWNGSSLRCSHGVLDSMVTPLIGVRRWSGRIHSPSNSTVTYQLNCLFIRALTMV